MIKQSLLNSNKRYIYLFYCEEQNMTILMKMCTTPFIINLIIYNIEINILLIWLNSSFGSLIIMCGSF